MAYKYGYRHVAFLKTTEAVKEELNSIYEQNNDGADIMSLQVIPHYNDGEYLPSRYEISYVYRYEAVEEINI